jgi:hypothetical protein
LILLNVFKAQENQRFYRFNFIEDKIPASKKQLFKIKLGAFAISNNKRLKKFDLISI